MESHENALKPGDWAFDDAAPKLGAFRVAEVTADGAVCDYGRSRFCFRARRATQAEVDAVPIAVGCLVAPISYSIYPAERWVGEWPPGCDSVADQYRHATPGEWRARYEKGTSAPPVAKISKSERATTDKSEAVAFKPGDWVARSTGDNERDAMDIKQAAEFDGWTVTVSDIPLEHSNADSLELDPEQVEAQFGEHESELERLHQRLSALEADPPAPAQPPILCDRLDSNASPCILVDDTPDDQGRLLYYFGVADANGNDTGRCWPATLQEQQPSKPAAGFTQAAVSDLTANLKARASREREEAREDGYRTGYRDSRAHQSGNRTALAFCSALAGAMMWVIATELVAPIVAELCGAL